MVRLWVSCKDGESHHRLYGECKDTDVKKDSKDSGWSDWKEKLLSTETWKAMKRAGWEVTIKNIVLDMFG